MKSADHSLHRDHLRRSRKGAWIEIGVTNWYDPAPRVAPVRERGLKLMYLGEFNDKTWSLP